MLKKKFILVLLTLMLTSYAFAGEKQKIYKVGTFPIPLMVESKTKGVFVELFSEIAKRAGIKYELVITPPKRTVTGLVDGSIDLFFPALSAIIPPSKKVYKSKELIYVKKDFVFTKKGANKLTTISDLEGKDVGITNGYPYAIKLVQNKKIKFQKAKTDEINVKKLMADRVVAFVVEEKSGLKAFDKMGLKTKIQYNSSKPISEQDVFFAFQKTKEGKRLETKISKAISEMKKDGTFGKIMSKAK